MATTLYIDFSDAQGQLTPQPVVESGRNSDSSELLCISSLPARMKKIQSKMRAQEWLQHFFTLYIKSMGNIPDARGQLTP